MPTPEEITRHHDDPAPGALSAFVTGREPRVGVQVVDPEPWWPADFAFLAGRIRGALGAAVLGLEHVGSTSVPGPPAKPVIDICLTVADSADEAAWLPPLRIPVSS